MLSEKKIYENPAGYCDTESKVEDLGFECHPAVFIQ